MTITTQSNKVSYSPSGSQTAYPFSFPIFDEDHLIVYRETAAGVVSTLTLGVDYTVSTATNPGEPIPWPSGGTVTTTSGYSDGKIVLVNSVPATQETDYTEGAEFPAESHEAALDKLTLIVQRALETASRSFQIAETDSGSPILPSAAARAGLFLAFDANGDVTVAAGSVGAGLVLSALGESLIAAASASAMRDLLDITTTRGDAVRGGSSGIAERLALGAAGLGLVSDGTDLVFGRPYGVVQMAHDAYTTYSGLTTTIPADDSIPQDTEGTELCSVAITPTHASNLILLHGFIPVRLGSTALAIGAIFEDGVANAKAVGYQNVPTSNFDVGVHVLGVVAAGSTSARTYKLRYGTGSSVSSYINGTQTAQLFGGINAARLIVTEVKANG